MDKHQNFSPWFASVPDRRRWPSLSGSLNVDTVVIGGGMAGVMTAWCIAEAGRDVLLLEKNHIATGDTGYTTAFLTRVPDVPSLADLAQRYGQECVNEVFAANVKAQSYLHKLIVNQKIACDYQQVSSYFGTYAADDPSLAEQWNVIQQADAHAALIATDKIPPHVPFITAVQFDHEAQFDVRKFLFGILERPTAQRITICEETEAQTITVSDGVLVAAPHGEVHAQHVIVATGNPHSSFTEIQKMVTRKITFALNAEFQKEAPLAGALFWDTAIPYHYFRRLDDRTIMLGGADRAIGAKTEQQPHGILEEFFRTTFGFDFRIRDRWSGTLFETADGLPIISKHPVYGEKVLLLTGFSGNGMVMGVMAGLLARDLLANDAPRVAKYFTINDRHEKQAARN